MNLILILICHIEQSLSHHIMSTAKCLPQPVVTVPIQVNVRRAQRLNLCDLVHGNSTANFAQFLQEQIIEKYKSPYQCRLQDLEEKTCSAFGMVLV